MERITERNFEMMSGKYQKEQLEIEARLKEVTETLNDSYEKSQGVRDFLSLIRNYQGLKELDATIINALIDKILVSEREKLADGTVRQEIKIYYKFIGFVGELHITPTKRWTALKPKNCTVCGVEYVPSSGISKYCPACAKRIQREKSDESKRRSRDRNRRACIELSAKNDRLSQSTGTQCRRILCKKSHELFRNRQAQKHAAQHDQADNEPGVFEYAAYPFVFSGTIIITQEWSHSLYHTIGSQIKKCLQFIIYTKDKDIGQGIRSEDHI